MNGRPAFFFASVLTPLAIAVTVACGHKVPRAPAFHAEVSDPSGDAQPDANVAVSPDLVRGTVDVATGTITFGVTFAPGTLDPGSTRVTIQIDSDQNPETGIRTKIGLGIDYAIDMWAATNDARVMRAIPGAACTPLSPCYAVESTAAINLTADGMALTLPMSAVTSTGRLNFRVVAYAMRPGVTQTEPTRVLDTMPDVTMPPGHVP